MSFIPPPAIVLSNIREWLYLFVKQVISTTEFQKLEQEFERWWYLFKIEVKYRDKKTEKVLEEEEVVKILKRDNHPTYSSDIIANRLSTIFTELRTYASNKPGTYTILVKYIRHNSDLSEHEKWSDLWVVFLEVPDIHHIYQPEKMAEEININAGKVLDLMKSFSQEEKLPLSSVSSEQKEPLEKPQVTSTELKQILEQIQNLFQKEKELISKGDAKSERDPQHHPVQ